jgi:hypothetical protein
VASCGGRPDNPAHLDVVAGVGYTTSRIRLSVDTIGGVESGGERRQLELAYSGPRVWLAYCCGRL